MNIEKPNGENIECANPRYISNGLIDVDINHLQFGWIPFTANPNDSELHGRQIYQRCINLEFGDIAPYVEPPPYIPTDEENKQRAIELLFQSDWASMNDVGDPTKSNPYLYNQDEFISWRSKVRAIAVNPVNGILNIFDEMPEKIWKNN
jgi:hypothetical protein